MTWSRYKLVSVKGIGFKKIHSPQNPPFVGLFVEQDFLSELDELGLQDHDMDGGDVTESEPEPEPINQRSLSPNDAGDCMLGRIAAEYSLSRQVRFQKAV